MLGLAGCQYFDTKNYPHHNEAAMMLAEINRPFSVLLNDETVDKLDKIWGGCHLLKSGIPKSRAAYVQSR